MTGWDDDPTDEPASLISPSWSLGRSLAASLVLGAVLVAMIREYSAAEAGVTPADQAACRTAIDSRLGPITSLNWSPDGATLAISHWGPGITLLDVVSGRRRSVEARDNPSGEPRFSMGWSADGRSLGISGYDGRVEIVEAGSGPGGHDDPPRVAICPEASLRFFGGRDRRSLGLLPSASHPTVLAFSRDGRAIASGSADGLVRIWGRDDGRERLSFPFAPGARDVGGVNSLAFAPDGATLAAAGIGGLRLYDPATGASKGTIGGDMPGFGVVAYSPDGGRLAAASWKGLLIVWDAPSGREVARMAGHGGRTLCLGWSPDGATLASGGYDGQVKLWDVPGRTP